MPMGTDPDEAKEFLDSGEIVAIPTETVYGLAGNAFDEAAVAKIFEVKKRPAFDPLILHTYSLEQAQEYLLEMPELAYRVADLVWPGPLTLVLPKKDTIPDIVTSGLDEVAIRVPSHPLTLELLASLDYPLVAPSANPFGYISPTQASHVADLLGDEISYILDGGACRLGLESTIIGFPNGRPTILRWGALDPLLVQSVFKELDVRTHSSSNPKAPGMLEKHYAPKANLLLGNLEALIPLFKGKKAAVLSYQKRHEGVPEDDMFVLTQSGNMYEAARHLFAWLREIDQKGYEVVLAERVPDDGLGKAINDRLKRAAAK
jgi:L-threonylcarbamoyladenylate synthase